MTGLSVTEDLIWEQLKTVLDPETHIDVVSMGFIREVKIIAVDSDFEKFQIVITYTLTTPGCPLAGVIQYKIAQAIQSALPDTSKETFDPDKDLICELTFDPPWRLQDMTEEARAELGF